ncbi:ABC transporter substrate-binding protein [Paenibacillus sp. alder61]|uniref:Carbohydrate ABC transporter substrate-binding protein n=2 Tax=Paenibacillus TaxID=44249 RepID=A0A5D0D035_9BACL|nr:MULTISPECIES: ABC transporter substrate-binding protein [Paenibacillus]MCA1296507.1 ABC transporter substrate-binding protein [Paenibacillus sp. alder61]TYA15303.1 carbohydrate ABC transporter substrate-binding protein [Paenibacillus faecis]
MNKQMKKMSTVVLVGLLSVSLAACGSGGSKAGNTAEGGGSNGGGAGEKVTIELAISKSSQDSAFIQQDLLDEFEQKSNIKVNLQLIPAEQTTTVLQTKLAVEETPDIIQYNLASATTDLNLERNFEILDNEPWASRIVNKDVLSAYGHIYSFHVSQDTGMQGVVYNKQIFEDLGLSIPNNFEEFLQVCEKIKASGVTPVFMPYKDAWAANVWPAAAFADFVAKSDPTFFDELNSNKRKWSDIPEFKTFLQQQYDVYKKGYTNADVLSDSYDMAVGKFLNKEVAMMFMGDWLIEGVAQQDPNMKLGVFPIPSVEGAKLGASPLGGQLFIPKKAKHLKEAKEFLNFLATKEVAQKIVDAKGYVSNFSDVTTPELPEYKQEIVDKYITPKNTVLTTDAYMLVDRSELYRLLQDQFAGGLTPEDVLKAWDEKFSQLMKDKEIAGF